jgi:tetratricopeptide (TPR) repeat protein
MRGEKAGRASLGLAKNARKQKCSRRNTARSIDPAAASEHNSQSGECRAFDHYDFRFHTWSIVAVGLLAMINSGKSGRLRKAVGSFWPIFCLVFGLFSVAPIARAATEEAKPVENPTSVLETRFNDTRKVFESGRTNFDAACLFARAAFEWGDIVNDRDRAAVAEPGIDAARTAVALKPMRAEGHYYLGLNLGQLARTKSLGALRIVKEMEQEFKKSIEIDPRFDFSGAYRSLGMLYAEAPGWPASIGNRAKGRDTLQKAVDLHPEFPDNQISLAEACLKAGSRRQLEAKLPGMQKQIEAARKLFTGGEWSASWVDWDKRWQEVKHAIQHSD